MFKYFNTPWLDVPIVVIDTETTGVIPGVDRAVQIGIVRFERGVEVGSFSSLVQPDREIPAEATAIHGINDEMVEDAPRMGMLFVRSEVRVLLADAQPCAFNADFDRQMVPMFLDPWDWPWLDPLGLVRFSDRYIKGVGRHKLSVTCERHGIDLPHAHSAEADARATGKLFYKIAHQTLTQRTRTLGQLLAAQQMEAAREWWRFNSWKASLPPLPQTPETEGHHESESKAS